jgi:hypothetical protein
MRGLAAEATALFTCETVSDEVLVARVRTRLGRVVSHPHAIVVTAEHGRVTLRGPIVAREVASLLKCVYMVRGVAGVGNQLEAHAEAGTIPDLQGGRPLWCAKSCGSFWIPGAWMCRWRPARLWSCSPP